MKIRRFKWGVVSVSAFFPNLRITVVTATSVVTCSTGFISFFFFIFEFLHDLFS